MEAKPLLKDPRYLLILPYMGCHFGALITGIVYHHSWAKLNGVSVSNVREGERRGSRVEGDKMKRRKAGRSKGRGEGGGGTMEERGRVRERWRDWEMRSKEMR